MVNPAAGSAQTPHLRAPIPARRACTARTDRCLVWKLPGLCCFVTVAQTKTEDI